MTDQTYRSDFHEDASSQIVARHSSTRSLPHFVPRRNSSETSEESMYHFQDTDVDEIVLRYSKQATLKPHTPTSLRRRFSELSTGREKSHMEPEKVPHMMAPAYQYFVQKSQAWRKAASSLSVLSGIGSTGAQLLNWIGAEIVHKTFGDSEVAQWLDAMRKKLYGLDAFKQALRDDEQLLDILCELLGVVS
jgi:hypothetical protein